MYKLKSVAGKREQYEWLYNGNEHTALKSKKYSVLIVRMKNQISARTA